MSCYKTILIILLTIIFIINVTFYLRATFLNSDYKREIQFRDSQDEEIELNQSVGMRVENSAGRYDNSRRYKIHDFIYIGEQWPQLSKSQNLCLATHTSADQLFRLTELAETWQGIISLSVFVPAEAYQVTVLYFQYLTRCFDSVRKNVSVHFVYPVDQPPTTPNLNWKWNNNCEDWENDYENVLEELRLKNPQYPQNHLRNVARKGCQTPYAFLIDVDFVPRARLALQLEHFLRNNSCTKCAFVVPAYEMYEDTPLPNNKSALIKLIKKKKAQYYHKTVFSKNQEATKPKNWEKMPDSKEIEIAYPVQDFPFFYEPFYIAKDEVPAHDERFIGYGFTRNTQTYEMHIAGYEFQILNSAFIMHRGFNKKPIENIQRSEQTKFNSKLLDRFKQEIYARYNYKVPTKKLEKKKLRNLTTETKIDPRNTKK